jgi:transcriptional regulator with XRE-family HTH domain
MPEIHHVGLGKRIRDARLAQGLTAEALADDARIMVSQTTVSRWEQSVRQPRGIVRQHLADVLHLYYHELFVPEEVSRDVTPDGRDLLLTAHRISRGGPGLWVTTSLGTRVHALGLTHLWLLEPADHHRDDHWRLTGSGSDVREVFIHNGHQVIEP